MDVIKLIEVIGNKTYNLIFESALPLDFSPPNETNREEFIQNKYAKKLYIAPFIGDDVTINQELCHSVKECKISQTLKLLAQRADINCKTSKGSTPLHLATKNKDWVMMTLLIQNGSDLNSSDIKGHTPLHISAMRSTIEAISILIRYGADDNKKDIMGKYPLDYAVETQHADSVTLLRLSRLAKEEKLEDFTTTLMDAISEIHINYDERPHSREPSEQHIANTDPDCIDESSEEQNIPDPRIKLPKRHRKHNRNRAHQEGSFLIKYTDLLSRMSAELTNDEMNNFEESIISRLKKQQQQAEKLSDPDDHEIPHNLLPTEHSPERPILSPTEPDFEKNNTTTQQQSTQHQNEQSSHQTISGLSPLRQVMTEKKKQKSLNTKNIIRHATSYRYMTKSPGSKRDKKHQELFLTNKPEKS